MTNKEKIRAINLHQNFSLVHPLTCGWEGCRADLKPLEREDDVVLECPMLGCDYIQEWIPEYTLEIESVMERYERRIESMGIEGGPIQEAIDYAREQADGIN